MSDAASPRAGTTPVCDRVAGAAGRGEPRGARARPSTVVPAQHVRAPRPAAPRRDRWTVVLLAALTGLSTAACGAPGAAPTRAAPASPDAAPQEGGASAACAAEIVLDGVEYSGVTVEDRLPVGEHAGTAVRPPCLDVLPRPVPEPAPQDVTAYELRGVPREQAVLVDGLLYVRSAGGSPSEEEVARLVRQALDALPPPVRTLVRADGPPASDPTGSPSALLQLVPEELVETVLVDLGASDLPPARGVPVDPGVYADVGSVDHAREVLVVWSSGQSGSCGERLRGLRVAQASGTLVDLAGPATAAGQACTADYRAYRQLVVLRREDFVDPAHLPLVLTGGEGLPDGLVVTVYPDV